MNKIYNIEVSEKAKQDIDALYDFIINECCSLAIANAYIDGIEAKIYELECNAEIFNRQTGVFYTQFGFNVRRVNYKKIAIIYTVHNDTVYIHRIIAGALITD